MEIGISKTVSMLFRFFDNDIKANINSYIINSLSLSYMNFENMEQVNNLFLEYLEELKYSLDEEELLDLRSYTGYNFRNINAILRGNWNYEVNGILTDENREKYRNLADSISSIIDKCPKVPVDFSTYRGCTLSSFKQYGITSLEELVSLKGRYLYEQGFTSTSIIRDTSYFGKELLDGKDYNIEIEYRVSRECMDGLLISNDDMSYSSKQNEYLFDKGTLSYVLDVIVDSNTKTAKIVVMVIPKRIYDISKIDKENKTK